MSRLKMPPIESIDFDQLQAQLDALPYTGDAKYSRHIIDLLVKYWMKKPKESVARILGLSRSTCERLYQIEVEAGRVPNE